MEGDRTQIQQVVVNLVRNAVEAMAGQPDRTLRIATRRHAEGVRLCIADTGPGLPPVVQQAPFQAFVTTKQTGLGLGLSVSRKIVEAHRGAIGFASAPDGTTFHVDLPAAQEEDRAAVA
ncbi:sensor histidine kinase [Rhodopila globiformis]|uniref:sensor histidine kinase n=1 Tax=Rhodopila globiformis TaxID=1071 RepID=UPI0023AFD3B4|nr:ATP-binding protein [Rhodopila globiformis]